MSWLVSAIPEAEWLERCLSKRTVQHSPDDRAHSVSQLDIRVHSVARLQINNRNTLNSEAENHMSTNRSRNYVYMDSRQLLQQKTKHNDVPKQLYILFNTQIYMSN